MTGQKREKNRTSQECATKNCYELNLKIFCCNDVKRGTQIVIFYRGV